MDEFIKLLSEFGFPIALCLAFTWFIYKSFCWMREDSKDREIRDRETLERFSGIISKNSEVLLENAQVMKQISKKLEDVDEKVDEIKQDIIEIKYKQQNK